MSYYNQQTNHYNNYHTQYTQIQKVLQQTTDQIWLMDQYQLTKDIIIKTMLLSRMKQILLQTPNDIHLPVDSVKLCNDRYFYFVLNCISGVNGQRERERGIVNNSSNIGSGNNPNNPPQHQHETKIMRLIFHIVSLRMKLWFQKREFQDLFSSLVINIEHNKKMIPMVVEFFIQLVDVFEEREVEGVGVGNNGDGGNNGQSNNNGRGTTNYYNDSRYQNKTTNTNNNSTNPSLTRLSLTRKTNNSLFIDSTITRKTEHARRQLNQTIKNKSSFRKQNKFQRQFVNTELNKLLIFANQCFNRAVVENPRYDYQEQQHVVSNINNNQHQQQQPAYFIKMPIHHITKILQLIHRILMFDYFGDRKRNEQDQYFMQKMPQIIPTKNSKYYRFEEIQNWIKNKTDAYKYQYIYFFTNDMGLKVMIVRLFGDLLRIHQKFFKKEIIFKVHLQTVLLLLKNMLDNLQIKYNEQYQLAVVFGECLTKILLNSTFPTFLNLTKPQFKKQLIQSIENFIEKEIIDLGLIDVRLIKYYYGFFVQMLERLSINSSVHFRVKDFKEEVEGIVDKLGKYYEQGIYQSMTNELSQQNKKKQFLKFTTLQQTISQMNKDDFETFFMIFRFYQPKKQYDDKQFTIEERLLWVCSRVEYNCYQYDRLTRYCGNSTQGSNSLYQQQHDRHVIKRIDLLRRYNLQCFAKLIEILVMDGDDNKGSEQNRQDIIMEDRQQQHDTIATVVMRYKHKVMTATYVTIKLIQYKNSQLLLLLDEPNYLFMFSKLIVEMCINIKVMVKQYQQQSSRKSRLRKNSINNNNNNNNNHQTQLLLHQDLILLQHHTMQLLQMLTTLNQLLFNQKRKNDMIEKQMKELNEKVIMVNKQSKLGKRKVIMVNKQYKLGKRSVERNNKNKRGGGQTIVNNDINSNKGGNQCQKDIFQQTIQRQCVNMREQVVYYDQLVKVIYQVMNNKNNNVSQQQQPQNNYYNLLERISTAINNKNNNKNQHLQQQKQYNLQLLHQIYRLYYLSLFKFQLHRKKHHIMNDSDNRVVVDSVKRINSKRRRHYHNIDANYTSDQSLQQQQSQQQKWEIQEEEDQGESGNDYNDDDQCSVIEEDEEEEELLSKSQNQKNNKINNNNNNNNNNNINRNINSNLVPKCNTTLINNNNNIIQTYNNNNTIQTHNNNNTIQTHNNMHKYMNSISYNIYLQMVLADQQIKQQLQSKFIKWFNMLNENNNNDNSNKNDDNENNNNDNSNKNDDNEEKNKKEYKDVLSDYNKKKNNNFNYQQEDNYIIKNYSYLQIYSLENIMIRLVNQYYPNDIKLLSSQINKEKQLYNENQSSNYNTIKIITYPTSQYESIPTLSITSKLLKLFRHSKYIKQIKKHILSSTYQFVQMHFMNILETNYLLLTVGIDDLYMQQDQLMAARVETMVSLLQSMINLYYEEFRLNLFNLQFVTVFSCQSTSNRVEGKVNNNQTYHQNKNKNITPLTEPQKQHLSKLLVNSQSTSQLFVQCIQFVLNFPQRLLQNGFYMNIQDKLIRLIREVYYQFSQFIIVCLFKLVAGQAQMRERVEEMNVGMLVEDGDGSDEEDDDYHLGEGKQQQQQYIHSIKSKRPTTHNLNSKNNNNNNYAILITNSNLSYIIQSYTMLIKFVQKVIWLSYISKQSRQWLVIRNRQMLPYLKQLCWFVKELGMWQEMYDNQRQQQKQLLNNNRTYQQCRQQFNEHLMKLINTLFQFIKYFLNNFESLSLQFVTEHLSLIENVYQLVEVTRGSYLNGQIKEIVDMWINQVEGMIVFGFIDQKQREMVNDDDTTRVMNKKNSNQNLNNNNKQHLQKYTGWQYIQKLYRSSSTDILQQIESYEREYKHILTLKPISSQSGGTQQSNNNNDDNNCLQELYEDNNNRTVDENDDDNDNNNKIQQQYQQQQQQLQSQYQQQQLTVYLQQQQQQLQKRQHHQKQKLQQQLRQTKRRSNLATSSLKKIRPILQQNQNILTSNRNNNSKWQKVQQIMMIEDNLLLNTNRGFYQYNLQSLQRNRGDKQQQSKFRQQQRQTHNSFSSPMKTLKIYDQQLHVQQQQQQQLLKEVLILDNQSQISNSFNHNKNNNLHQQQKQKQQQHQYGQQQKISPITNADHNIYDHVKGDNLFNNDNQKVQYDDNNM